MTKLLEWLSALAVIVSVWLALITHKIETEFAKQHSNLLLCLPIICVVVFGFYSLTVVLYRTFTFNDCPEAAKELQEHIKEARANLTRRGFKFVK